MFYFIKSHGVKFNVTIGETKEILVRVFYWK